MLYCFERRISAGFANDLRWRRARRFGTLRNTPLAVLSLGEREEGLQKMRLRGSFLAANPTELPPIRRAHGPTSADDLLSLKLVVVDGNGPPSVRLTAPPGLLRPLDGEMGGRPDGDKKGFRKPGSECYCPSFLLHVRSVCSVLRDVHLAYDRSDQVLSRPMRDPFLSRSTRAYSGGGVVRTSLALSRPTTTRQTET